MFRLVSHFTPNHLARIPGSVVRTLLACGRYVIKKVEVHSGCFCCPVASPLIVFQRFVFLSHHSQLQVLREYKRQRKEESKEGRKQGGLEGAGRKKGRKPGEGKKARQGRQKAMKDGSQKEAGRDSSFGTSCRPGLTSSQHVGLGHLLDTNWSWFPLYSRKLTWIALLWALSLEAGKQPRHSTPHCIKHGATPFLPIVNTSQV